MRPLITLALLALCALGCGAQPTDSRMWTTKDSWYRALPRNFNFSKARLLSDKEFFVVARAHSPRAQTLLTKTPVVALSASQARWFKGKTFAAPKGTKPFLVRAVYLNEFTGAFSVYQQGTSVAASHYSLGHHAVPMKRTALVVFLKKQPTQVFVTAGMAE